MLLTEYLAAWLSAKVEVPAGQQELPEKSPNEAIAVIDTGGLGLRVEAAFDVPTFQLLIRAEKSHRARDIAYAVDRAIVDIDKPLDIGGVWVTDAGRVGGRPQALAQDDRRRWIWTHNVWIESERK